MTTIRSGDDVHAGIRAFATPGHTPGHLSFEVAGGDGLIVVGDAVTAPAIFFPHPDWTFGFDFDDEQAVGTRRRLLDRAAHGRTTLLGYHWPFPAIGYAERDGRQYRLVPAADSGEVSARPSPAIEMAARESGLTGP